MHFHLNLLLQVGPGFDDEKPISKPTVQQMLLPIIAAMIVPFEGNNTVPQADRDNVGKYYKKKFDPAEH